jgi:recombination protein RecA
MSDADKILKALKARKFEVSFLSDDNSPCTVTKWISTGCIALDAICGGGIPTGRLVEFFGAPSSGKSLIASQIAANAQKQGAVVAYADTESSVSKAMMVKLGVDIDQLIYDQPDSVEQIFDFFDGCVDVRNKVNAETPLLLIWDSVAATSSESEMTNDYGKATMGIHARLISQSLRKFIRIMSKQQISMLFLNQIRENIGVMYGDKYTTFGGLAIPFHSSIRVSLKLSSKIKIEHGKLKQIVGMNTLATCVKNKIAVPFAEATLPIHFGSGIDDAFSTLYYLEDHEMVDNNVGHYTIIIDAEEYKFTKATWREFFDPNRELLRDIIMSSVDSDANYASKTEDSEVADE